MWIEGAHLVFRRTEVVIAKPRELVALRVPIPESSGWSATTVRCGDRREHGARARNIQKMSSARPVNSLARLPSRTASALALLRVGGCL
jgi:hypothetical protein